jgi:hypothetical protein
MATLYGSYSAGLGTVPVVPADGDVQNARVRVLSEKITLATQTTSDTIVLGVLPIGATFLYGLLTTTVTLGTSTIAIGISGTTGKYRAAATFTTVDTPTLFGVTTGKASKLTAAETVFITIATASLPASGTLHVDIFYSAA